MSDRARNRLKILRHFVRSHPEGWGHEEWERLLTELRSSGLVSPGEEPEVGRSLERERVVHSLERLQVAGLGPKRREAVATAFENMWELERASARSLAEVPTVTRTIAEELAAALR